MDVTGARDGRGCCSLGVRRRRVTVLYHRLLILELKSWTSWWRDADSVGGQEDVDDVGDDVGDLMGDQ